MGQNHSSTECKSDVRGSRHNKLKDQKHSATERKPDVTEPSSNKLKELDQKHSSTECKPDVTEPSNNKLKKLTNSNLLVGAIDIGTTYSGYAYSFYTDFAADPTKAFVKQWNSGTVVTEKTPTVLLIRPDGKTIEAFGYEAENKYRELTDDGQHEEYYYFRRFKMMLNTKLGDKLGCKMTLEDEMGRSLMALDVFSMAIKSLVDDMMKDVQSRLMSAVGFVNVRWVLTVPAIWTDAAKQFMRQAALKAGISSDKLSVALEPEAASLYCRHLSVEKAVSEGNVSIAKMSVGTTYMILDAGGGTIDSTVHEVVSANSVKEVHAASGGGWGGILVDEALKNVLVDLVGREAYDKFKSSETEDWLDLWRDFEVKKRTVQPKDTGRIIMKIPLSFSKTFETVTERKFEDAIAASKYAKDLVFGGDKLKFSASLFKSLFDNSIQKTVDHITLLLKDERVKTVKAILMVGGYSESQMLQQAIKGTFPDIDVVVPLSASSTILKGALVYGHRPTSIIERVLKYTYGVEALGTFREGIDPDHLKTNTASGVRCMNIFSKHVEKGQIVKCKEKQVEISYHTVYKFQRRICFPVYASTQKYIRHTYTCTRIGEITLDLPEPEESPGREVLVSMTFGGTEIEVGAVDVRTGKEATAFIDFLG